MSNPKISLYEEAVRQLQSIATLCPEVGADVEAVILKIQALGGDAPSSIDEIDSKKRLRHSKDCLKLPVSYQREIPQSKASLKLLLTLCHSL